MMNGNSSFDIHHSLFVIQKLLTDFFSSLLSPPPRSTDLPANDGGDNAYAILFALRGRQYARNFLGLVLPEQVYNPGKVNEAILSFDRH